MAHEQLGSRRIRHRHSDSRSTRPDRARETARVPTQSTRTVPRVPNLSLHSKAPFKEVGSLQGAGRKGVEVDGE
jgi:hypothetical protein